MAVYQKGYLALYEHFVERVYNKNFLAIVAMIFFLDVITTTIGISLGYAEYNRFVMILYKHGLLLGFFLFLLIKNIFLLPLGALINTNSEQARLLTFNIYFIICSFYVLGIINNILVIWGLL